MGMRTPKDINSAINATATPGIAPQSLSGSTAVNGTAIDRLTTVGAPFASCSLVAETGTSTGTPTSYSHAFTIQHAVAASGPWNNYIPSEVSTVPTATLTTDNTQTQVGIDLSGANQFVRVVATPSFTGGTSPTTPVAASLVFGGAQSEPAQVG